MISIITATYNRSRTIMRVYDSLRNQKNFEWIVVDDGSSDGTRDLLDSLVKEDNRVKYYRLEKNVGVNRARMHGVRQSEGRFVFFLDSDDELEPYAIEELHRLSALLVNKVGILVLPTSSYNDENGIYSFGHRDMTILSERDIICNGSLEKELSYLYRRDVFDKNSLPSDLKACEFLFVYGLSKNFDFITYSSVVVKINRQADNLSSSTTVLDNSANIAEAYLRLIINHDQALTECRRSRRKFLIKVLIRKRISGESTRAILQRLPNNSTTDRLAIHFFDFLPPSFFKGFSLYLNKFKNYRNFGVD